MSENAETKAWFSARIEEHTDSLFSLAHRLARNTADAEDLVAESVAKAWSNLDSLQERERFRPWIFRILHNTFISHYRKRAARPNETLYDENPGENEKEEISNLLIKQPNEFLSWWANPEREFVNNLLGEDIYNAIEGLPEVFRIAVQLINVEGLSYDETAEILGVPSGTVRSRMKRGRTLLQKILWEHAKDAGIISGNVQTECGT